MKKQYVLLLLFTLSSFLSYSSVDEKILTLYFETDEFTLTKTHESELTQFLNSLSLQGDYEFMVRGHTDQDGSNAYNLKLSENRALSICSYLYNSNVNPELTSMSFAGELELAANDLTQQAKSQNRRVQVIFRKYVFEDLSEVHSIISEEYKTEEVFSASQEHTMIGKHGTELEFSSLCFLTESGLTYDGEVKVELNEALDLSSFLAHGLSTSSEGEMLLSGGMLKVAAYDEDGNPLLLNSSKPVNISMPTVNMRDDMNVFLSQDGTDWEITEQRPSNAQSQAIKTVVNPGPPPFRFKEPKYEGERKPIKPTIIATPKMPVLPDSSRYFKPIPWYSLNKKETLKSQKTSFDKALLKYKVKVGEFQERTAKKALQESNYDERMAAYELKLRTWEKEYYDSKKEYMNRSMKEQYARYVHKYKSAQKYDYQEARENQDLKKAMDSYEANERSRVLKEVHYAFSMASLGWVNIDCFTGNKEEKKEILVHNPDPNMNVQVKLLFPDINSCLSMGTQNFENFIQTGVPVSQTPKVVAYKIEEGSIYYCERDLNDDNYASLKFEYITFSKFREKISALA